MPRWDYVCETCGVRDERIYRRFEDAPDSVECDIATCAASGGKMTRQPASGAFKLIGRGFHVNDYRGRR